MFENFLCVMIETWTELAVHMLCAAARALIRLYWFSLAYSYPYWTSHIPEDCRLILIFALIQTLVRPRAPSCYFRMRVGQSQATKALLRAWRYSSRACSVRKHLVRWNNAFTHFWPLSLRTKVLSLSRCYPTRARLYCLPGAARLFISFPPSQSKN